MFGVSLSLGPKISILGWSCDLGKLHLAFVETSWCEAPISANYKGPNRRGRMPSWAEFCVPVLAMVGYVSGSLGGVLSVSRDGSIHA